MLLAHGLIHGDCMTITGKTVAENLKDIPDAPPKDQDVIRQWEKPMYAHGHLAILRGNLALRGAVIKQGAASSKLMQHEGRALVFDSVADMAARIDDPSLDVTENDVLVLRNAGPIGAPGMPEAGYLPIPKKLAQKGIKDMVRISDARMSGTAFGTIVLHIAPEAAVGGLLALVKSGDKIRLDVNARTIDLLVDEAELKKRKDAWKAPAVPNVAQRGYARLYREHVQQADEGCDFDFLARFRCSVPR